MGDDARPTPDEAAPRAAARTRPRVTVAGHLCLDLTPGLCGTERIDPGHLFEVGPLAVRLGGSVANTGGGLVDLGFPVTLVATVGDDPLGALLHRIIDDRPGMTARLRRMPAAATSYSLVVETPESDRTFWHHVGGNAHFDGTELDDLSEPPDRDGPELLHLGYPNLLPALLTDDGEPLRATLARARERGVVTSLDLAVVDPRSETGRLDWATIVRRVLPETDIITPSIDDLTSALRIDTIEGFAEGPVEGPDEASIEGSAQDALTERLAQQLIDWGAAIAAVTAGPRGLYLAGSSAQRLRTLGGAERQALGELDIDAWAGLRAWVPAYPVRHIVTTTGAGDAATAGFLAGLLTQASPRRCGAMAMASAAAVVSGRRPEPRVLADIMGER